MSRWAHLLPIALTVLFCTHACIGWGVNIDEGCAVNAERNAGFACVERSCRKVCGTSNDCLGSERCGNGVCVHLPGAACTGAKQCTAPTRCEVGPALIAMRENVVAL